MSDTLGVAVAVAITDEPYTLRWSGETIHQYQAYCTRCLRHLSGPTGHNVWATKAPAVRAAKAHIEEHPYLESYLDRRQSGISAFTVTGIITGQPA